MFVPIHGYEQGRNGYNATLAPISIRLTVLLELSSFAVKIIGSFGFCKDVGLASKKRLRDTRQKRISVNVHVQTKGVSYPVVNFFTSRG